MISLTAEAIAKIKSAFSEQDEHIGIRIAVAGISFSGFQYKMTLDKQAKPGDNIIHMDGLQIYVDVKSSVYLTGTKIDYVEGKDDTGFTFDNPNLKLIGRPGETFDA